jgi:ribosomal protein S3
VDVTAPEKLVLTALGRELPDAAMVEGIRVRTFGVWVLCVTLVGSTSALLIGRRGATSDALRLALAEAADDSALQLNIREWKPPSRGRFGLAAP